MYKDKDSVRLGVIIGVVAREKWNIDLTKVKIDVREHWQEQYVVSRSFPSKPDDLGMFARVVQDLVTLEQYGLSDDGRNSILRFWIGYSRECHTIVLYLE